MGQKLLCTVGKFPLPTGLPFFWLSVPIHLLQLPSECLPGSLSLSERSTAQPRETGPPTELFVNHRSYKLLSSLRRLLPSIRWKASSVWLPARLDVSFSS